MPGPWVSRPPLGTARGGLDSVDADGVIYAIGGFGTRFNPVHDGVEVRDPVSEQWTFGEPMSMPRGNPGAAYVDGRIYVVGGGTGLHNDTNKGESFAPSDLANGWTRIRNRPGAPFLGPGAVGFAGRIYIIGGGERGMGPGSITNDVSIYDPSTDRWSNASPMPTARMLFRAVELDGQIYAVGGAVAAGQPPSSALERYDPIADTWASLRPMSVGRGNPGVVAAADGRIIVVGGAGGVFEPGGTFPMPTVEAYDPQTDAWAPSEEPLPVARASLSAERGQGNTILAIGGFEPGTPAPPASARVESRPA
jgi:N-acetylneuraminic acid mutarotase